MFIFTEFDLILKKVVIAEYISTTFMKNIVA